MGAILAQRVCSSIDRFGATTSYLALTHTNIDATIAFGLVARPCFALPSPILRVGSIMPSVRRNALWGVILGAILFVCASNFVPATMMGGRPIVIAYSARAVLGLLVPCLWVGWSLGWLLLPPRWKSLELLLMPLLGMVALVPASYYLNYLLDMRTATLLVMLASSPLGVLRLRRERSAWPSNLPSVVPLCAALALLVVALIPHLIQGSLGLLSQSLDEETYFYLAHYLQHFPAGASMSGPLSPIFEQGSPSYRAEGWGYQYLLAIASSVGGIDTFQSYLPTSYLLLALGVISWYLFCWETLGLPRRWCSVAAVLYAANGLPFWFATYGYARQTAWIAMTPLVLATLSMALRFGDRRSILLAGLSIASLVGTESRVGLTQMAVSVAGLGAYWLLCDRRWAFVFRLVGIGAVAALAASPALWWFVNSYLVSGTGASLFQSRSDIISGWGPQLGGFPPIQVALGLEPEDLVRISEPIPLLKWLDPLDAAMRASSGYLAYLVLLLGGVGGWFVARKNPICVALTAGLFLWAWATQALLQFPYGYFKLFGVVGPVALGYALLGVYHFRDLPIVPRLPLRRLPMQGKWLVICCLLATTFFARNTAYSFLFSARGWGLSIPPALVNELVSLGDIEPGARVFVSGVQRYPVPEGYYNLRKDHRLAMQSREQTSMVWADRFHAIALTSLVGHEVYGVFNSEQHKWSRVLPGDGYDYYLLSSDEDPRCRGLGQEDLVVGGYGMALYRAPKAARASSETILAHRGTLNVDAASPLVFTIGADRVDFGSSSAGLASSAGRVCIGLLALNETVVDLQSGDLRRRLALDAGLNWYTTPTINLPVSVRIAPLGAEPVRVVAIRDLPPGAEDLDKSQDSILSSQAVLREDGVDVELWFSNPMGDAKGASAKLASPQAQPAEQRLAMQVPAKSQRWLLRFAAKDGTLLQLRDAEENEGSAQFSWARSGGDLSLVFTLGHEAPRGVLLASLSPSEGKAGQLVRYVDPVQLRLWGSDDRPKEKQMPDMSTLEGSVVRSDGGLVYLVQGGKRHWVPDGAAEGLAGSIRELSPEQLWLIPPGLPLDAR